LSAQRDDKSGWMMRFFWMGVLVGTLVGCSGPANATGAPVDETAAARKLYVTKCAKCHKFYDPATYSDEEWRVWMVKMSKKSKLKPAQERALSRYIEETYRAGAKKKQP
jgi:hypothetical protein